MSFASSSGQFSTIAFWIPSRFPFRRPDQFRCKLSPQTASPSTTLSLSRSPSVSIYPSLSSVFCFADFCATRRFKLFLFLGSRERWCFVFIEYEYLSRKRGTTGDVWKYLLCAGFLKNYLEEYLKSRWWKCFRYFYKGNVDWNMYGDYKIDWKATISDSGASCFANIIERSNSIFFKIT